MKKILVMAMFYSVALATTSLKAEEGGEEKGGEKFTKAKEHLIKNIEKRIGHLTEMKTCVEGASDGTALKSCRDKMKAFHEEMKGEREKFKEERSERKKEKANKKNK